MGGYRGWTRLWDRNGSVIFRKKSEILEEIQHGWERFFKWYRQIRREITLSNSPLKTPFCDMAAIASESYEQESSDSELDSSDLDSDDLYMYSDDSGEYSDGSDEWDQWRELASDDSEKD